MVFPFSAAVEALLLLDGGDRVLMGLRKTDFLIGNLRCHEGYQLLEPPPGERIRKNTD